MTDSRLIRWIDLHIGSLLCGVLSLPAALGRLFRGPKRSPRPRKILVIELFEMGAAIMIAPSLNYLKEQDSGIEVSCLTTSAVKESWTVTGLIPEDRMFVIGQKGLLKFGFSAFRQLWRLRKTHFDLIIDYELFFRASAVLVTLLKAKVKAGIHKYEYEGLFRGWAYDIHSSYNQNQHISKNYLALTKAAFLGKSDHPNLKECIRNSEITVPLHQSNPTVEKVLASKLMDLCAQWKEKRMLVISPTVGQNLALRNYSPDSYVDVIRRVLKTNPDVLAVLIGTHCDHAVTSRIKKEVNHVRCLDFSGQTNFAELLELLSKASLVLTNDNGIAHFTSLTNTPSVALFSMESPFIYGPLGPCTAIYSFYHCSPCVSAFNHKNSNCQSNECLKVIQPATVASFVQKGLEGRLIPQTVNNVIPYLVEAETEENGHLKSIAA